MLISLRIKSYVYYLSLLALARASKLQKTVVLSPKSQGQQLTECPEMGAIENISLSCK